VKVCVWLAIEGDSMKNYYTLRQAMELLGFRSLNAFRQLERKHPEAFVNINPDLPKRKALWYDKATLDKFAETYERLKQMATRTHAV
jgi:hypothetical protein